jgi:hypothetical protein
LFNCNWDSLGDYNLMNDIMFHPKISLTFQFNFGRRGSPSIHSSRNLLRWCRFLFAECHVMLRFHQKSLQLI